MPRTKHRAPRFVVQEHHATRLHWDLRLEHDGVLASWAIPNGIPPTPQENRLAVRTEDHPLQYLDFHGEIPKGEYGAGTMEIWDTGTYETHKFDAKKVEVTFHGERLNGRYGLFPIGRKQWPGQRERLDDPPNGSAGARRRRRRPRAGVDAERIVPMLADAGGCRPTSPATASRSRGGCGDRVLRARPDRLESRNLNGSPTPIRRSAGSSWTWGCARRCSTGDVAFDEAGKPSFERLQSGCT